MSIHALNEFKQEFYDRIGFRPNTDDILWLILQELYHVSTASDALAAASTASIAEMELVLAALNSQTASNATLQAALTAALANSTGADPDLEAAATAAVAALDAENTKAAGVLAAIPAPAPDAPAAA